MTTSRDTEALDWGLAVCIQLPGTERWFNTGLRAPFDADLDRGCEKGFSAEHAAQIARRGIEAFLRDEQAQQRVLAEAQARVKRVRGHLSIPTLGNPPVVRWGGVGPDRTTLRTEGQDGFYLVNHNEGLMPHRRADYVRRADGSFIQRSEASAFELRRLDIAEKDRLRQWKTYRQEHRPQAP